MTKKGFSVQDKFEFSLLTHHIVTTFNTMYTPMSCFFFVRLQGKCVILNTFSVPCDTLFYITLSHKLYFASFPSDIMLFLFKYPKIVLLGNLQIPFC